jgi:hypothetical protein
MGTPIHTGPPVADLVVPHSRDRRQQPCHRDQLARGSALLGPAKSAMGQAATNIGPKENGEALGQNFGPTLFIIFHFLLIPFFNINSRNSFKILKCIENEIKLKKLWYKFL